MKTTTFGRHRFQDDSTISANNNETTVVENNEEGKKTLLDKAKDNWKPMAIGAGILAGVTGVVWGTKKYIVPAIKQGIDKAKAMCGSSEAPAAEEKHADDFEPTK
jgi:hypothetical protein